MKIKIGSCKGLIPNQYYWVVKINEAKLYNYCSFSTFEGAINYVKKYLKRYYKECAAFSMTSSLAINLLSITEKDFVQKMKLTKCKGITAAQYGYLKGIHERQERAW